MRQRWKALVAVGVLALFASLLFLLPPRDDGLDWIRKYGAAERTSHPGMLANYDSLGAEIMSESTSLRRDYLQHDFIFAQIPEEVAERAIAMNRRTASNIWLTSINRQSKTVTFQRKLSWLQRYWAEVKHKLGLG